MKIQWISHWFSKSLTEKPHLGPGKMTQSAKCLFNRHEGWSLILRTHVKKKKQERKKWLHMVAYAYNPSVGKAETGRSLGLTAQPAQPIWGVPGCQETSIIGQMGLEELHQTLTSDLPSVDTHVHIHTNTYKQNMPFT